MILSRVENVFEKGVILKKIVLKVCWCVGSQDKTCKLWDKQLALVATLRGHKRGIWCARFSPHDRLLATGSADAVIKLWSLGNGGEFPCVKQLEEG